MAAALSALPLMSTEQALATTANAIVPYVAQAAKAAEAIGGFQQGVSTARKIYKGLRPKRASRNGKASAKRARFSRDGIGEKKASSNTKRTTQVNTSLVPKDSRTLYVQNVTLLQKTQVNRIDARQRDLVNLRGIKLCFELRNTSDSIPLYGSMALIADKKQDVLGPTSEDFFRANDQSRGRDLDDTLTGLQYHCLPINTDRYHVLWHQRVCLNPGTVQPAPGPSFNNLMGTNYMKISKWVKINRQIRYNSDSGTGNQPENGNLWVVYFFDQFGTAAGTISQQAVADVSEHHVCYFKETKD